MLDLVQCKVLIMYPSNFSNCLDFYSYLESLGATLPPKPEAAKAEEGKCPMKEDTPAPPEPEGITYYYYLFYSQEFIFHFR